MRTDRIFFSPSSPDYIQQQQRQNNESLKWRQIIYKIEASKIK